MVMKLCNSLMRNIEKIIYFLTFVNLTLRVIKNYIFLLYNLLPSDGNEAV